MPPNSARARPPLADLAFDAASVAKVIVGPAGSDMAILDAAWRICRNRRLVCPASRTVKYGVGWLCSELNAPAQN